MKERRVIGALMVLVLVGLLMPSYLLAISLGTETSLTLTNVSPGKVVGVYTSQYGTKAVYGGIYNLELGDEKASYDSFCIDFFHYAPISTKTHVAESLNNVFGYKTTNDIYQLWENNYFEDMGNIEAFALRVALWEVTTSYTHFTTDKFDVLSGKFSLRFGGKGVGQLANSDLAGWTDEYVISDFLTLVALTNPSKQNSLVPVNETPVPEPCTMLLMGAGIIGSGMFRLRKGSEKK